MATITSGLVKELRERTGAGMMDCKKALVECDGDMDKAIDFLREKGLAAAAKKAGRIAAEGMVYANVNHSGVGVVIEVNCETDFVANTDRFKELCRNFAEHVAVCAPANVDEMLNQPYYDDATKTVQDLIGEATASIGEKISIRRFARFMSDNSVLDSYVHMGGRIGVLLEATAEEVTDEVKALCHDLSLHIQPGELYGFIGHNGAGKTTTIKACCGILDFDEGEIYINGTSIKDDPIACKRQIAYLPDNPDLYDYMSGIQYLSFVADIFGVSKADREERIHRYASMFELTGDLAQSINAYSHGMKQKLALISALIHDPKLLIMDEPFVGLDPKASRLFKDTMREICDRGGAIFFSTHVLEVAEKLCDKVAIIKDGVLIKHGTMEEVRGDASLESVFLELEGTGLEEADE